MKLADKSVAKYRQSICNNCEYRRPIINQCKLCGCFMSLKTKIDSSKCPINKWGSSTWGGK